MNRACKDEYMKPGKKAPMPKMETNSYKNEKGKGSMPVKFPAGEMPKEGPKSSLWGYEK